MCGIWTLLSSGKLVDYAAYYAAFMKIKHRGPENSYFECFNDNILLGFHRLAMMDRTIEGNQPFHLLRPDGSYCYLVCNGEIYEYEMIKKEHEIVTKSHSDCEVILPLYEKYGIRRTCEILSEHGSEYAFLILDVSKTGRVEVKACRDPLGVRPLFVGLGKTEIGFSSEMKGLSDIFDEVYDLPGGKILHIDPYTRSPIYEVFHDFSAIKMVHISLEDAYLGINRLLKQAVRRRLSSDRELVAFLSGGLDSSLVVALMRQQSGKSFPVYTIAFDEGSEDLPYAKMAVDHLKIEHQIEEVTYAEMLNEIDDTVYTVETWDITTNRASVMQKRLSYKVSKSSARGVLVGENSDELFGGYLYSHFAPSGLELHKDSLRLMEFVRQFDGKRSDMTLAKYGLEGRFPYADTQLIDFVLSLPYEYILPQGGLEKSLLRNAFKDEKIIIDGVEKPLLPPEILFRRKNAFSDAVSLKTKSWKDVIQEHFQKQNITPEMMLASKRKPYLYRGEPFTAESRHYLEKFQEYFSRKIFGASGGSLITETKMNIIPFYWMPRWIASNDPSARTLNLESKKISL